MDFNKILTHIIEQGIEAVKKDYKEGTDKYNGAIAGFEECRNKTVEELTDLLIKCREETSRAFKREIGGIKEGYWFIRCFEAEVEWVCNVLSAILMTNGLPVIIYPTYCGIKQAVKIIGSEEE